MMHKLINQYKVSFFGQRHTLLWRAPIMCSIIENTFGLRVNKKHTIVDVGCAIGEYVREFQRRGYTAIGIEGCPNAQKFALAPLLIIDMRLPIEWKDNYTLCICLEVAEHIEGEFADVFVENLTKLSNTILFSAAPPGQGGHHHYNCQPMQYWEDKFAVHGYRRIVELEELFKEQLRQPRYNKKKELGSYKVNSTVFKKGE